jgi:hypothetical protein
VTQHDPPPPGLAERLSAQLPGAAAPARPLPGPALRALALLAILGAVAIALGFITGGKGWRTLSNPQRLTLVLPLLAMASMLAWDLSLRMVPGSRLRAPHWLMALGVWILATAWTFTATPLVESSRLFYWICILFTSTGAAASAWALTRWLRRGFVTLASTRVVLAAACGLAGFLAVEFFCPYVDAVHIFTSHVLPGALAGGLAAWAAWREFR